MNAMHSQKYEEIISRGLMAGDEISQMQGRAKIVMQADGTAALYTRADGEEWLPLKTITPTREETEMQTTAATKTRVVETENNETLATGVFPTGKGTWLAMTLSASKTFKTRQGAERWLASRTQTA